MLYMDFLNLTFKKLKFSLYAYDFFGKFNEKGTGL